MVVEAAASGEGEEVSVVGEAAGFHPSTARQWEISVVAAWCIPANASPRRVPGSGPITAARMPADRSGPDSSAETLLAAAAWHARQTEIAGSTIRRGQQVAPPKFGADAICRRTGRTTSSRSIQPIGSAIGTETGTTFGMVTIAVSLTVPGSFLTLGFIHGGRIGIRTTTTATVIPRSEERRVGK